MTDHHDDATPADDPTAVADTAPYAAPYVEAVVAAVRTETNRALARQLRLLAQVALGVAVVGGLLLLLAWNAEHQAGGGFPGRHLFHVVPWLVAAGGLALAADWQKGGYAESIWYPRPLPAREDHGPDAA